MAAGEICSRRAVEYNGELFAAGAYEFAVDGRYFNDFDRQHPIEGPARAQAWKRDRSCADR